MLSAKELNQKLQMLNSRCHVSSTFLVVKKQSYSCFFLSMLPLLSAGKAALHRFVPYLSSRTVTAAGWLRGWSGSTEFCLLASRLAKHVFKKDLSRIICQVYAAVFPRRYAPEQKKGSVALAGEMSWDYRYLVSSHCVKRENSTPSCSCDRDLNLS